MTSVLLVGDGRSGTTWVSGILNIDRRFRFLFEPFHPSFVREARLFRMFQYIRPESREPYFLDAARAVFSGELRSARVDRFNQGVRSGSLLIKDIFAHLFLRWVRVNFPDVKLILLLRHPFGVAASKANVRKWHWAALADLLDQADLVEDHFQGVISELSRVERERDQLLEQVAVWSAVHSVALRQLAEDDFHLAFYEDFYVDPVGEARRAFAFIGMAPPDYRSGEREQQLRQPAGFTHRSSPLAHDRSPLHEWREAMTSKQVARGGEILGLFGLEGVYPSGPMPDAAAAKRLLR